MRGLLLAASLPEDTDAESYWSLFESSAPALSGLHVHDPFAGGGSTLVEAARLGASVSGTDVDPLAVEIVRHEIESVDEHSFVVPRTSCSSSFSSESATFSIGLIRSGRLSTISTFTKLPVQIVVSEVPFTKTSLSPVALTRLVRLLGAPR